MQNSLFPEDLAGTPREQGTPKNYVLDTNVLLHDPHCLNRFENNHVFIPIEVLSELDRFKNEQSDRGANARMAHRFLTTLFGTDSKRVIRGAPTPGGGTVCILLNSALDAEKPSAGIRKFRRLFPDQERMDHRIIGSCLALQETDARSTILVTKDLNMQLKGLAIGLQCQDYLNDKVSPKDAEGEEMRVIAVEGHELQRFGSTRMLILPKDRAGELERNEYVILQVHEDKFMPARYRGKGEFQRLKVPASLPMPMGMELKPANPGQQCFLDALLDPDISLITCYGQAGTGKTLLAVAAGLFLTGRKEFNGMTVSRPVVAMGDTLGFLPGTLNEKMHPWLQSIYDAFDVLLPLHVNTPGPKQRPKNQKKGQAEQPPAPVTSSNGHAPVKPYEKLIERGLLEIEALCYIRGRSIPNRFFVLDEAQQLTPLEAKTVVTRMSRGSKLVMVGDPNQIDNPYVDSRSNGLVFARNRLRGEAITAHVSLTKGERSDLAEIGARLM
jgi:PhoH-like ATPase